MGLPDNAQPALLNAFLLSTKDALMVFEAARRGICPIVTRRLHDNEKASMITSGSVFAFDEQSTGIKRWTDGALWSPSRIIGNYLVYRELEKKDKSDAEAEKIIPMRASPASSSSSGTTTQPRKQSPDPFGAPSNEVGKTPVYPEVLQLPSVNTNVPASVNGSTGLQRDLERALVGSLTTSYRFKKNGLVKKTISNGSLHIVCYYTIEDVMAGRLRTPSSLIELSSLEISSGLLNPKNFRSPPFVEYDLAGNARFLAEATDMTGTPTTQNSPSVLSSLLSYSMSAPVPPSVSTIASDPSHLPFQDAPRRQSLAMSLPSHQQRQQQYHSGPSPQMRDSRALQFPSYSDKNSVYEISPGSQPARLSPYDHLPPPRHQNYQYDHYSSSPRPDLQPVRGHWEDESYMLQTELQTGRMPPQNVLPGFSPSSSSPTTVTSPLRHSISAAPRPGPEPGQGRGPPQNLYASTTYPRRDSALSAYLFPEDDMSGAVMSQQERRNSQVHPFVKGESNSPSFSPQRLSGHHYTSADRSSSAGLALVQQDGSSFRDMRDEPASDRYQPEQPSAYPQSMPTSATPQANYSNTYPVTLPQRQPVYMPYQPPPPHFYQAPTQLQEPTLDHRYMAPTSFYRPVFIKREPPT